MVTHTRARRVKMTKRSDKLVKTYAPDCIDTGYVWECPVCGKKYHLIHRVSQVRKKISHAFEDVVE